VARMSYPQVAHSPRCRLRLRRCSRRVGSRQARIVQTTAELTKAKQSCHLSTVDRPHISGCP
jgi:hypothetical protein